MQDEYPKEYKKMGEELRQTVEEILAKADKMAKDYAWTTGCHTKEWPDWLGTTLVGDVML